MTREAFISREDSKKPQRQESRSSFHKTHASLRWLAVSRGVLWWKLAPQRYPILRRLPNVNMAPASTPLWSLNIQVRSAAIKMSDVKYYSLAFYSFSFRAFDKSGFKKAAYHSHNLTQHFPCVHLHASHLQAFPEQQMFSGNFATDLLNGNENHVSC